MRSVHAAVLLCLCPLACGAVEVAGNALKAGGPALASEGEAKLDAVFSMTLEEVEGLKPGLNDLEALRNDYISVVHLPSLEARRARLLGDVRPRWEKFLRLKLLFAQARASEQRGKFASAFQGFMKDRSIPVDSPRQFARANGLVAFAQDLRSFHDWGANVLSTEEAAHQTARRVYAGRRRALLVCAGLSAAAVLAWLLVRRRSVRQPRTPASA